MFNEIYCTGTYNVLAIGPPPTSTDSGTPIIRENDKSDSNNAVVIGIVIGVCVLVMFVFCTVLLVLLILYLNNKRARGQQQWKDPEFQVDTK